MSNTNVHRARSTPAAVESVNNKDRLVKLSSIKLCLSRKSKSKDVAITNKYVLNNSCIRYKCRFKCLSRNQRKSRELHYLTRLICSEFKTEHNSFTGTSTLVYKPFEFATPVLLL